MRGQFLMAIGALASFVISKWQMLLRYGITGVTGGVIQTLTLAWWVEIVSDHDQTRYRPGVILGFCTALIVTFLMQKYWTFRDRSHARATRQFILYGVIALASLFGNAWLMYLFVEGVGMWYIAAQLLTIAIVSGLSFILNYLLTFRTSTP